MVEQEVEQRLEGVEVALKVVSDEGTQPEVREPGIRAGEPSSGDLGLAAGQRLGRIELVTGWNQSRGGCRSSAVRRRCRRWPATAGAETAASARA